MSVKAEQRVPGNSGRAGRATLRPLVILLLLGGLAWWGYAGLIAPNLFPQNFGVVEAGKVYRSAALTPAATKRIVEQRGIRTIIDLGGFDKKPEQAQVAQRTAEALGVKRYVFELEGDGTGNPNAYVAALRVLNDAGNHPVLIHCSAGAQRTSACVILYRHVLQGRAFFDVYHEAYLFEHVPERNRAMGPYLLDWAPKIERAFREGGWIPGQPDFANELNPAAVAPQPPAPNLK